MGRKITATALAAALLLSGSGPIYAQEIRAIAGGRAGRTGPIGVPVLPPALSPLSAPALDLAPAPANPSLLPNAAPVAPVAPQTPAKSGEASALPVEASDGDAKDFGNVQFR